MYLLQQNGDPNNSSNVNKPRTFYTLSLSFHFLSLPYQYVAISQERYTTTGKADNYIHTYIEISDT